METVSILSGINNNFQKFNIKEVAELNTIVNSKERDIVFVHNSLDGKLETLEYANNDIYLLEMYLLFMFDFNTSVMIHESLVEEKVNELISKYNYKNLDDIFDDICDFCAFFIKDYKIEENGVNIIINKQYYEDYNLGIITPFRQN